MLLVRLLSERPRLLSEARLGGARGEWRVACSMASFETFLTFLVPWSEDSSSCLASYERCVTYNVDFGAKSSSSFEKLGEKKRVTSHNPSFPSPLVL